MVYIVLSFSEFCPPYYCEHTENITASDSTFLNNVIATGVGSCVEHAKKTIVLVWDQMYGGPEGLCPLPNAIFLITNFDFSHYQFLIWLFLISNFEFSHY